MLRRDELVLHQVRVRARGRGAPAPDAVRRTLLGAATPAVPDDEVIVLRRLELRGRLRELPGLLGRELGAALRSGAGERRRFATPEQCVAELAVAIVQGRASEWPWRALAGGDPGSAPETLRRLFLDHAPRLAAVVARLAARREAAGVLLALEPAAARETLAAVVAAAGLPAAVATHALADAPAPAVRAAVMDVAAPRPVAQPRVRLAGLAAGDPRVALVVLLEWLLVRPRRLAALAADDGASAAEFARACASAVDRDRSAGAVRAAAPRRAGRFSPDRPAPERVEEATPQRAARDAAPATTAEVRSGAATDATGAIASRPAPAAQEAQPPDAGEDEVEAVASGFCGLFRLLPFLIGRAARERLAQDDAWCAGAGGFRLLRECARSLAVSDDDPLATWLDAQAAAIDAPELPLPPLDVAPLLALGVALHGRELFGPGLVRASGRLLARAARLDVVFPAHELRLDVRLAGLDVDPGFVPWLGRVVRFHYALGGAGPR